MLSSSWFPDPGTLRHRHAKRRSANSRGWRRRVPARADGRPAACLVAERVAARTGRRAARCKLRAGMLLPNSTAPGCSATRERAARPKGVRTSGRRPFRRGIPVVSVKGTARREAEFAGDVVSVPLRQSRDMRNSRAGSVWLSSVFQARGVVTNELIGANGSTADESVTGSALQSAEHMRRIVGISVHSAALAVLRRLQPVDNPPGLPAT